MRSRDGLLLWAGLLGLVIIKHSLFHASSDTPSAAWLAPASRGLVLPARVPEVSARDDWHAALPLMSRPPPSREAAWQERGAGVLAGLSALSVAAAAPRGAQRHRATQAQASSIYGDNYNPDDWTKRVKFIEGERAVFEVTIPKPLGLKPRDFPNRPGVGVASIDEGGNTDKLNQRVVIDGEPGMFVLEGDEVVGVNGVDVEGKSLEEIGPLVKNSPGDSVTLKFVRYYMAGPVKVVFIPSGRMATMRRKVEISVAAKAGVQEVAYSCKEGWCKACWHTDPMFGIVYRACASQSKRRPPPKNPRTIPEKWNSIVPLWLIGRRDAMELVKQAKEKEKADA